jgi:hypothetical protein
VVRAAAQAIDRSGLSESMVIGYDANDPDALVVTVGAQFTELPAANCIPMGSSGRPLGESHRREYMKRVPGKLK